MSEPVDSMSSEWLVYSAKLMLGGRIMLSQVSVLSAIGMILFA